MIYLRYILDCNGAFATMLVANHNAHWRLAGSTSGNPCLWSWSMALLKYRVAQTIPWSQKNTRYFFAGWPVPHPSSALVWRSWAIESQQWCVADVRGPKPQWPSVPMLLPYFWAGGYHWCCFPACILTTNIKSKACFIKYNIGTKWQHDSIFGVWNIEHVPVVIATRGCMPVTLSPKYLMQHLSRAWEPGTLVRRICFVLWLIFLIRLSPGTVFPCNSHSTHSNKNM